MERTNDPARVAEQYQDESRLTTRTSVWRATRDGRYPHDVAANAIRDGAPTAILEVGCGTGAFARRLADENAGAEVVATDQSERFIQLTAERGITARVADIESLPFDDNAFDVVAAMWMLYHVGNLHRGLSEVRRVLRPGGTFVAATNGNAHLADLMTEAGGGPLLTQFSSESGAEALAQHFDQVARVDLQTWAVFPDHDTARAYLSTFDQRLADGLPAFEGEREYAGATTVFISGAAYVPTSSVFP